MLRPTRPPLLLLCGPPDTQQVPCAFSLLRGAWLQTKPWVSQMKKYCKGIGYSTAGAAGSIRQATGALASSVRCPVTDKAVGVPERKGVSLHKRCQPYTAQQPCPTRTGATEWPGHAVHPTNNGCPGSCAVLCYIQSSGC
jgi:hypothetical protein